MNQLNVRVLGAVLLASCWAGCAGNQTGHVSATTMGDTSHPAERGSPTAALEQACGAQGDLTSDATPRIRRAPYLQQLTTSSVIVGWLSTTGDGERIDVTRPDGTAVVTAQGKDDTSVRATGEKQMWSTITGLEPDTVYCYTLAAGSTSLSERIGFRTAPAADATRTVKFLAFGDSGGGGSDQFALLEQMMKVPFDIIIHTGDIAYDSGTLNEFEDNVFAVYSDLFRHFGFFPAAGNHDYKTMQGAPFRDVFNLPADNGEKWYSYDYGPVHFVALDTESDYATQMKWLDRDLAATKQPWKILYMHKPPYSSGEHGSDVKLRMGLEPLLAKYNVQLVLAGHDHDYERVKPQNGVEFIVTGGGGKGTRPVGSNPFTEFSIDVIHFVYVEVKQDELVLHAIDGTGVEFDSVVVPRERDAV
ncbi:MAG: metallophosphoesterase family protein [Kofleriaceae bacterium]|nr:metallophosphoesterase family protein [Kofleriaceae bacterium]